MRLRQISFVALSVVGAVVAGLYRSGPGPVALHLLAGGWLSGALALMALDALGFEPGSPAVLSWLVWSMAPVAVAVQVGSFGTDVVRWDLLWAPAAVGMAAAWSLIKDMPTRLRRTLRRLADREVLSGGPEGVEGLAREMDRIARRWAWGIGAADLVLFAVTGPLLSIRGGRDSSIWLGPYGAAYLAPILLGLVVLGAWTGRLAAYGRLGVVLGRRGMRLRVVPDHPDGAGGLRPIGAYFLYQSLLVAISPVYMITWLVIFSLHGGEISRRYQPFADQFHWLIPVGILFEILAFLVPMQSIHAIMRTQKETALWSESDRLSRQIEDLRRRLAQTIDDHAAQEARLGALVVRFEMLERAPTWPVDASIRKRFTLRNLALLLPLVGYAFGNGAFWEKLADILTTGR